MARKNPNVLIEVTRRFSAHYRTKKGGPLETWRFYPDRINQVPRPVWDAILAKKDPQTKKPVIQPYLDSGMIREVDPKHAQAVVDGKASLAAAKVDKTPAQEIAEASAKGDLPTPKPSKVTASAG